MYMYVDMAGYISLAAVWAVMSSTLCTSVVGKIPLCPPSPEDSTATLLCEGVLKTRDSKVIWERHWLDTYGSDGSDGGDGDNRDNEGEGSGRGGDKRRKDIISHCDISRPKCFDKNVYESRMELTEARSGWFNSTLTLHQPGARNRQDVYQCVIRDERSMEEQVVSSCRLNMYAMPKEASCTAKIKDSGQSSKKLPLVEVTCTTQRIYPGVIHCELLRRRKFGRHREDFKKVSAHINYTVATKKSRKHDSLYSRAKCQTTSRIRLPGIYDFQMNMYPVPVGERSGKGIQPVVSKASNTVNIIFSNPTVRLEQFPLLSFCPDHKKSSWTINFMCSAMGLESEPKFEWLAQYVQRGSELIRFKAENETVTRQDLVFQTRVEFPSPDLATLTRVVCQVRDVSGRLINKASIKVRRELPVKSPPRLATNNLQTIRAKYFIGASISFRESDDVVLECDSAGGSLDSIMRTSVRCQREPNPIGENSTTRAWAEHGVGSGYEIIGRHVDASRSEAYAVFVKGDNNNVPPSCVSTCWVRQDGFCFSDIPNVTVHAVALSRLERDHWQHSLVKAVFTTENAGHTPRNKLQTHESWAEIITTESTPQFRKTAVPANSESASTKNLSNVHVIIITVVISAVVVIILAVFVLLCCRKCQKTYDDKEGRKPCNQDYVPQGDEDYEPVQTPLSVLPNRTSNLVRRILPYKITELLVRDIRAVVRAESEPFIIQQKPRGFDSENSTVSDTSTLESSSETSDIDSAQTEASRPLVGKMMIRRHSQ
ncbi:uncharacterized protein LOC101861288 [Aplysia californica]|uniref:Uncharacterized protein LOC101861288 n=1 Tax=Aplysia californica TaxID=6500 RepID=A0ABM0JSQ8_APLCA|nr:uncharacterized protein LOC101861288 [Aplysia californica]